MIVLYIHNSIDDIYTIMGIENNRPILSDQVRGRFDLQRNLDYLIEEFKNKNKSVVISGLDIIEKL